MSETGISAALQSLVSGGEAAGSQAQFAQYLQLFTKLVAAIQSLTPQAQSPYKVFAWTAAGNLNIATSFPSLTAGTISVRQGTPAAVSVTLPNSGGPWIVVDGAGVAGADHITILPPGGFTINNTTSYVISANWTGAICILDGTNYIVTPL